MGIDIEGVCKRFMRTGEGGVAEPFVALNDFNLKIRDNEFVSLIGPSGCCRFHAYISIEKRVDGEGKVAAIASLPYHDELKHVVVVDSDVDPFNEKEVLWAVATRVQAGDDVEILKRVRGGALDPSSYIHAVGDKMLIDATRPISRPYAERIKVPQEVMDKIKLKDWI